MKVCLLSDQYKRIGSGIGIHARGMVKSLTDMGHEVTLICNENPGNPEVDYIYIKPYRLDPTPGDWLSLFLKSSNAVKKLRHIDIFHSLDARQGAWAAKTYPSVGNMNDYYYATCGINTFKDYKTGRMKRYLYGNFTKFIEKHTLKNFNVLIANSEATRNAIMDNYGLPPEKVVKISKALYDFPKNRNTIKEKEEYDILMVGVNLERKGIYCLIAAAKMVLKIYPLCRFHVVGKPNTAIYMEALEVIHAFRFYGTIPNDAMKTLYEKADLFILPSLSEGFGISILEAMSRGLPVIATDIGGIPELVKDGHNGMLIKYGNSEELADSIVFLLGSKERRERLSRNAFKDARRFNFKNHMKEVVKVYEGLK